jgi:hypothetical protein
MPITRTAEESWFMGWPLLFGLGFLLFGLSTSDNAAIFTGGLLLVVTTIGL